MRPPVHPISVLIDEGRIEEARTALGNAMRAGDPPGTISGACKVLGMSLRHCFRVAARLGMASRYDGHSPRKKRGKRVKVEQTKPEIDLEIL